MDSQHYGVSRSIIETMVRKTVNDMKDAPERSIRNLVDLAQQSSHGRFQKDFFKVLQNMLQNERSAYYTLIQRTVQQVELDRLLTFGMNLGYNSCTAGAAKIRKLEQEYGYNIPWAMLWQLDDTLFTRQKIACHSLIQQGEALGIFTWLLFASQQPLQTITLPALHPNHAFVLFCKPEYVTEPLLEQAADLHNLMIAIQINDREETEQLSNLCKQMRKGKLLYAVYYYYGEEDLAQIANGDLFCTLQQLNPVFMVLLPKQDCNRNLQQKVYQYVLQARENQNYSSVILELYADMCLIDQIISEDSCFAWLNRKGCLCAFSQSGLVKQESFLEYSLTELLQRMFPKSVQLQ